MFDWFSLNKLKRYVHCAGFLVLSHIQILRLWYTYDCNNVEFLTASFTIQRQAMFFAFCFLSIKTRCGLYLFCYKRWNSFVWISNDFESTYQMLTYSSYCRIQCVKSVCICSYSGPHFPAFGLNSCLSIVSLTARKCGPE